MSGSGVPQNNDEDSDPLDYLDNYVKGSKKVWSNEEIDAHPFFMRELPEGVEPSVETQALQALVYDDDQSPEELAEYFKKEGNELLKRGSVFYRHAVDKYSEGIDLKCSDDKTNCLLHANRAQANLLLRNYGRVVEDCDAAIALDETYAKAYFRAAKATFALEKWDAVVSYATRGLTHDADNKPLQNLKDKAQAKIDARNARKAAERKAAQAEGAREMIVNRALKKRGVTRCKANFDYKAQYNGDLTYDAANDEMHYPLLLLYGEFSQTDWVADCPESACINDALEVVLASPPIWDPKGEYVYGRGNLTVYVECLDPKTGKEALASRKSYVKVDPSKPLREVLANKEVVIPGIPVLQVCVKGSAFEKLLNM